ncbi:hypothetical protein, partial [Desulfovibrio sp.]|uniref:hypothetical protein n=1 Tax=Desulfovibrio sp. TaxID=885 RepID=UPI0030777D34
VAAYTLTGGLAMRLSAAWARAARDSGLLSATLHISIVSPLFCKKRIAAARPICRKRHNKKQYIKYYFFFGTLLA